MCKCIYSTLNSTLNFNFTNKSMSPHLFPLKSMSHAINRAAAAFNPWTKVVYTQDLILTYQFDQVFYVQFLIPSAELELYWESTRSY